MEYLDIEELMDQVLVRGFSGIVKKAQELWQRLLGLILTLRIETRHK